MTYSCQACLSPSLAAPRAFSGLTERLRSSRWRSGNGRTRLCPARDRAQQVCRRRPARQGRGLRRGTGRLPARPPGDLLGPRRAQIGACRGRAAADALCRRHLPAGQQGAYRGRPAPRERPPDDHDRPRGAPPRRSAPWASCPRARCSWSKPSRTWRVSRCATPTGWPSSRRRRCRSMTPPTSSRRFRRGSRTSSARTRKTSATPPPTGRRR